MTRLFVVAGLLFLGSACVDMRLRLQLARDGGGALFSDVTLGPKTTELLVAGGGEALFNDMVPPAPQMDRRELRDAGVRRLTVDASLGEQWSGHTELHFRQLGAVDRMIERNAVTAPHFSLVGAGGGTWELRSLPAEAGSLLERGQPPAGAMQFLDQLKEMGEDQAMVLMLGLLGEMSTFRVVIEVEVPGEVVEVSPTEAVEVQGGLVRWTYDMATLSGPLMKGLKDSFAGGQPPQDPAMPALVSEGTRVRFMPRRPMPDDAAWPR